METSLRIYNSLSRKKEVFKPISEGYIGMYVCGPTVYSDVHLGNCRTFVSFDLIYRYLLQLGYKVRYVRNITDVGHLLDDGEDRMSRGARLEQLEPMEVAQKYANGFQDMMKTFNTLPPSIEPRASGHIIEQIDMVQKILDNGFGYEVNGSVYFDIRKYVGEMKTYGKLSGRKVEDLLSETRDLKNQEEKRHPADFAIWIKADPTHIMRWPSPWSMGFPGWHLECSAMSTKYLGESFDIHGGGGDLKFPHHENEIAQNVGACHHQPARYWMHTNMLLMNGRKMSKSEGNTISPQQLFTGDSENVSKGYSPTIVRFFMLQTHYRSTLDLTDSGLQAAEKGYRRIMEAYQAIGGLKGKNTAEPTETDMQIERVLLDAHQEMNDDFNTPRALARLFELVPVINSLKDGHTSPEEVRQETLDHLQKNFEIFLFRVFGLVNELSADTRQFDAMDGLMQLIIEIRQDARARRAWPMADKIRDHLAGLGIQLKDGKDGTEWGFLG